MKKTNDKELGVFMKTDIHKDYALPADAGMKSASSFIINESKPHFKVSKDIDYIDLLICYLCRKWKSKGMMKVMLLMEKHFHLLVKFLT